MKHIREQEKIQRPWVKNAAIIFLSIMLALTFFSKTIMNVSLPEVTGQYTTSGSISESVSGMGTVAANLAYNVQLAETRTVSSVKIAAGDSVEAGDVLFTLEPAESEELTAAEEALSQMEYDYEVALVQAVGADYAVENQNIQSIRDQLNDAIAARDSAATAESKYNAARSAVQSAQQKVSTLQNEIADLEGELSLVETGDAVLLQLQAALDERLAEQSAAEAALSQREQDVAAAQAAVTVSSADAQAAVDAAGIALSDAQVNLASYGGDAAAEGYAQAEQAVWDAQAALDAANAVLQQALTDEQAVASAQAQRDLAAAAAEDARQAVTAAQQAVDDRQAALTDGTLTRELAEKKAALGSAQARLNEAQATLSNVEPASYEAAKQTVRSLQQQLSAAIAGLSEQQKQDGVAEQTAQLDLEHKAELIDQQEQLIEQLKTSAGNTSVKAQYSGTVATVPVVVGDIVGPGTTMATIHVDGKEYTMTVPVTAEQAQRLTVGAAARVTNFYYGNVQAVLTDIKNDPDAPGKNKLLEFTVSGDVMDGQSLSVSIDLGSQNYTTVIPKSALRSDQNGDFIYAATSQDSPLGTRYVVERVPVSVLATDAYNAAIETASGYGGLYAVTTSSAPLSSGDQVRISSK